MTLKNRPNVNFIQPLSAWLMLSSVLAGCDGGTPPGSSVSSISSLQVVSSSSVSISSSSFAAFSSLFSSSSLPAASSRNAVSSSSAPAVSFNSAGCGKPTNKSSGTYHGVTINGPKYGTRKYDVRLPNNYDPDVAYPMIVQFHGCSAVTNNTPMESVAGNDAIIVRGHGVAGDPNRPCWNTSPTHASRDYVLDMVAEVPNNFCVNTDQIFATGYSSGTWLVNSLACHSGDIFRGMGTVSRGEHAENKNCKGQVGQVYVQDTGDNPGGSVESRTRALKANNCSDQTKPISPSPCVDYQGCDAGYPVTWCLTTGRGHNRQDNLAPQVFWNFFRRQMEESEGNRGAPIEPIESSTIEAEKFQANAQVSPFETQTDSGRSIVVWPGVDGQSTDATDTTSGQLHYSLTATANRLNFYATVNFASATDDSFFYQLEGKDNTWQTQNSVTTTGYQELNVGAWSNLTIGQTYVLKIQRREDGAKFDSFRIEGGKFVE
ncbi:MAG: hypothetical protein U5M23_04960 [Marinagarivorans sp.]|nr:hypothetical protein [Marinagarivorans sp.]